MIEHLRKGDQYTVVAVGKMESSEGDWVPSITFRKQSTGEIFTRATSRLINKFKIVA